MPSKSEVHQLNHTEMPEFIEKNKRPITIVGGVLIVLLVISWLLTSFSDQAIRSQEDVISSNMTAAVRLLDFEEQANLSVERPVYQNYSDSIQAACTNLDGLDQGKNRRSDDAKHVCEDKKGLDNCFFQVERIRTQIGNNQTDVNLDSLDVLCSDLRSLNLQPKLDDFKANYENYTAWLKDEGVILSDWESISSLFWNNTEESSATSIADYAHEYRDRANTAKTALQDIVSKCASRGGFQATLPKVGMICGHVDDYVSDMDRADTVISEVFGFFSGFETGTITIDALFVRDCNEVNRDFAGLYDLKLLKDSKLNGSNESDFASLCGDIENMSNLYGSLGIPLIFTDGQLSSTTRMELFKAKTVYIETDTVIGSGVVFDYDSSGYYILTNAHVALLFDAQAGQKYLPSYIRVKFYDGRVGYATKLGYTQDGYDLVILYVPSSGNYPIASYDGNTYPNAGDKVVAVGNPYGLAFSVTEGTVSAVRDIGCVNEYCYGISIQTDTAINPGNSGGGLWSYDSQKLLGINSLGLTQAQGLNFAISMYQYEKIKDTFKWYTV